MSIEQWAYLFDVNIVWANNNANDRDKKSIQIHAQFSLYICYNILFI